MCDNAQNRPEIPLSLAHGSARISMGPNGKELTMPTSRAIGASPSYRLVTPRRDAVASGYAFSVPNCRCPECGDILIRIPRRGVDRVLSLFVPVHRFRCPNFLCVWEGNLRTSRSRIDPLPDAAGLSSAVGRSRRQELG
jgi:hypothetical protein